MNHNHGPVGIQSPPRRPEHPRDVSEREAYGVYSDLLDARNRCRWPLVRNLQGVLYDLGYIAEPVGPGFKMVRIGTARRGVA
jgi:hypothetical protein